MQVIYFAVIGCWMLFGSNLGLAAQPPIVIDPFGKQTMADCR